MHGSPMSSFDNCAIWQKYSYKDLNILAEPCFDLNFNDIFHITDTDLCLDGHLFNVRDNATKENTFKKKIFLNLKSHSTLDIIKSIESGHLPNGAMLNFHPQRWNQEAIPWLKEFIWQNVKNQVKRVIIKIRG